MRTKEQREHLEVIARLTACAETFEAITAALADLDAAEQALAPVARELHAWREREPGLVGDPIAICLDPEAIDAILNVTGGLG
jgi:hypothetical protein